MSASETRKLLIVDDDEGIQRQLRWAFSDVKASVAGSRGEALEKVRRDPPQVVILDLAMPPDLEGPGEGFAALEEILAFDPLIRVIVASGNDERENAVMAIKLGAYDFCSKPVDLDVLKLIVDRAFYLHGLETEIRRMKAPPRAAPLKNFITEDKELLKLCTAIEHVAPSNISVMFTGESGTGKEVLAKALHDLSSRSNGPFVAINCAAIPENLLESELFGHEKGAFTGAVKRTTGKFEMAHKGTLFLDEIGEMAPQLQAKLLRFLQERTIERVGGRESLEVDVRIVSATNRDLSVAIKQGGFREDLFYRLNEINFDIPPLRRRTGDALLLAHYFLDQNADPARARVKGFSPRASNAIAQYNWPGNVRELENRVRRAVVLCDGKLIEPEHLDLPKDEASAALPTLREAREQLDRELVSNALAAARENVSQAAKILGVSRPTLYELMKSLGMKD